MTDTRDPSWVITFKSPEPGSEPKTLTIPAESMITALKQAQVLLAEFAGGPYRIVMIEVAAPEPRLTADETQA